MDDLRSYLGKKLRDLRKKKNLSAKELGNILDVDENTIWGYEGGRILPSLTVFKNICIFFSTSSDELLGIDKKIKSKKCSKNYVVLTKKQASNIMAYLSE